MSQVALVRRATAEFVGTFGLVTAGGGAIIVNGQTDGGGLLGVALAFGFTLAALIGALGHISGGHFNPAVTVAMFLTGRMRSIVAVVVYIAVQIAGAVVAALTLEVIFGGGSAARIVTNPSQLNGAGQSFLLEILLTAFLVFVVFGVATDKRASATPAGLAIGLVLIGAILWGGPISGASLNPARSLGPALVSGDLTNIVMYLVAPLIGGVIAGFLYVFLQGNAGK